MSADIVSNWWSDVTANRKQELRARAYGYNLRIGLRGIVAAYESGCQNQYEIAEHLGVTEEYLIDALEYYRSKYGIYATIDNYVSTSSRWRLRR